MYLYELEIVLANGQVTYKDVWAENTRDALETGELMFPDARYIDVV